MLKRLWRYCNKIFSLTQHLSTLKGIGFSKKNNEPFLTAILLIAMFMRLKSFNALENAMKRNGKIWKKILNTDYLPSVDIISRRIENSDIKALLYMNMAFVRKLHRNKAFNTKEVSEGLMVAAVDGHETFASEKRCCQACRTRKKTVKGEEVTEYFHSYVICQLVLCSNPEILDIEPILPGEGELTAAKRLIKRILKQQPRRIHVFAFDALYLDSEISNMLEKRNKYWITVLKQENREAYQEIDRLLSKHKPIESNIGKRKVVMRDMHELVGWDRLDKPFRGVVSDEEWDEWQRVSRSKKIKVKKKSHWRWLTNMPSSYSAEIIHRLGHGRWNEENRGFNDLVNNCHFDHPFHHHPTALLAMLWIIAIAFNLSYTFFLRNLKPELKAREIQDRSQLAMAIIESFRELDEPFAQIRAP
jgi:hypothetical protein